MRRLSKGRHLMAKKKNSRKALAVALGIMGVAGLSVASASQLTVNVNDDNVAVGAGTFAAACDNSVDVDYTYSIATSKYTNLEISDIANACAGKTLDWTLHTSNGDLTGTVASLSGTSVTASISSLALTESLTSVDIAIH